MDVVPLSDAEFKLFKDMIYATAGINLSDAKKPLVSGRLAKRIKHHQLKSFGDYFRLVKTNTDGEFQIAIDLLTTNETFFFREPKHFNYLRDTILPAWNSGQRRVWSAASSSGEEGYTLAMMLAEHSPTDDWEIVGTDISTRVLERARSAQYPLADAEDIPRQYLTKYCLKGIGSQEGTFLVGRELRRKVSFIHANLQQDLTKLGMFDVIFLRNVLIYFNMETKQRVVASLLSRLKPGGYFIVGHSESLNGITDSLKVVVPSIYLKP
jgi:chemotaxis protein methyltransferase CheR